MPPDRVSNDNTTNLFTDTSLEQRITALEEENKALKATLEKAIKNISDDRNRQSTFPKVTRRQTLAALLGGGALFGTTIQPGAAASSTWEDSDGDNLLETPNHDGIDVGKLNTEELVGAHAAVNNTSTVLTQPHQPELNSYKTTFSWSEIPWEDKGSAIIDASNAPNISEAAWPTVVNASSVFANPIDDWYCFWSGHSDNYIGLSTAPSPWGPWSYHSQVFSDPEGSSPSGSQTASPSAVVVPEDNRLNLYYHVNPTGDTGGIQYTKLATTPLSGDGTSYTIQGVILDCPENGLWDQRERTYMNVIRFGGAFLGAYQGRGGPNPKGIGLCHSFDGETFIKTQQQPAFDNTQFWPDYDVSTGVGSAPTLSFLGGELTVLYASRSDNYTRGLPYSMRDKAPFQKGEPVYGPPNWTNGDIVITQDFVATKKHVYMFYMRGGGPGGKEVGVARAPQGDLL